ncbi:conserved hypothetical protein [Anaeromyxobacter dehalogenans 2CP-1]|uniref:Uncharacterized protein n=1 Tax=Anaeromyxobacter dehalogenans (strain ATCC BAA-258 / DSM 21875 / 2CP-1) TaxID=455488 RepID=B8J5X3_ANAD2|nr:hypothetical protein [Anaeromyxobacter dehalogenans]ACL65070.1 conserved hypothetical protein [Anaeromyxobacter dehalogenans 2CP-1]
MTLRRDFIQRMLEQLGWALAGVLKLRRAGAHEQAVQQLESTATGLVGIDLRMVASVESATAAALVAEPERLLVLARLCLERAEIAREQADPLEAGWRRRAVELWLEAAGRGAPLDAESRAAVEAEPEEALSPRARTLRAALPPR